MQFHRISSAELSRRTLVPKQTICDWLAGVPPENVQQLKSISNFLTTSVDELCFAQRPAMSPLYYPLENRKGLGFESNFDLDCDGPSPEDTSAANDGDNKKEEDLKERRAASYPVLHLKGQLAFHLDYRGWTCSELSRQTGVPKQTLHNWLKGRVPRRINQLKSVAECLEITVDDLCFSDPLQTKSLGKARDPVGGPTFAKS